MASPGLEEGYLRYAHTLDAALAYADFGKAERVVLREVFAQLFGPAKRRLARLRPGRLASMTGLSRPNASRTIRRLVEFGVLERRSQYRYRFIKNYESWTTIRKGGPAKRFTPKELGAIAEARAHALYYRHDQESRGESTVTTPVVTTDTGGGVHGDNDRCHQRQRSLSPQTPLILRREKGEEEGSPTPPTYRTTGGPIPGGLVGDGMDAVDPSTHPDPLPPGLAAVADRSARIPALYAASFGPKLRTAWRTDGRLQAWWQEHPDAPAWSEALNDLAGVEADKRHIGMYLAIVRRLARKAAVPAAAAPPRPDNSAAARRKAVVDSFRQHRPGKDAES